MTNTHTPLATSITPEQRAERDQAERARNLASAEAVTKVADYLAMTLRVSGGRYRDSQCYALFKLCNAMIGLVDDGDCLTQRDILMHDLRIDEDGNPVPECEL